MSWRELMIVLVVSGIIWYAYVLGRYYPELFKRKQRALVPVKWAGEKESIKEEKVNQHAIVHELIQELKLVFTAAIKDELNTLQIKEALGVRLSKYTSLTDDIKLSVSQHISNEFSLQLKMNVTVEEVNSLWK